MRCRTVFAAGVLLSCWGLVMPTMAQEWVNLLPSVSPPRDAVAGEWSENDTELMVRSATGARLGLPARPQGEYDFRVSFTRTSGVHSVALIFAAGGQQATFEIDAWGQHLAGIQNIGGNDLRANARRATGKTLQNGRRYTAEIRVRRDRIIALLDGATIMEHASDGRDLRILDVWKIPDAAALGLGAWEADTTFHQVEYRVVSNATTPPSPSTTKTTAPPAVAAKKAAPSVPSTVPAAKSARAPRVLLVIANLHFFYREYADPRQELERAGCVVEVAAGQKSTCYPHPNTGEGADRGAVMPDLAIADADASRYDAILFSGGWGSSMYQYAFEGRYHQGAYNGDRRVKQAVNQLINDFVRQDKYVCGLCHGVSVLAWCRINGRSLLAGRRVTAPDLPGPDGAYGRGLGTMPSRWNAQVNGATLVPPNSVGDPSTPADDVVRDGKVLTGQDDPSAREMGRQLAALLRSP